MPLDVADVDLPHDFNSSFTRGYAQCDPWLLHRAFKLWENSVKTTRPALFPDHRLFALPGYDLMDVKSADDLDPDDVKRVRLVESAATLWALEVCFARLTLRYYGPRSSSPGGSPPIGYYSGRWDLQSDVDYIIGLTRLSDMKGDTILSPPQDIKSNHRLHLVSERHVLIQDDFFGRYPDEEVVVRNPGQPDEVWVRQAWTRNASLLFFSPNRD
ncbi:hypothetical protein N658DRAFT_501101 [Parathielavia hyrcaniae]|uniref:Uncharacterized protein n=1 Tax=Parathielavia hyrcaniae TaxID=113614 RepID=A0AAN6PS06_9PEZI|nr:hypothetical protein N658DRAFT_501101 [Parathielavia hyrcaniae]